MSSCLRKLSPDRELRFASGSADDALEVAERAELIVIDLDAAGTDGIAASVHAIACATRRPIVAIGSADDEATIDQVLRAGAWAYVPRAYDETQLLAVLQLALHGAGHRPHSPFDRQAEALLGALQSVSAEDGRPAASARLTPKQVEVLALAADGLSNRQIAARLGITEGTVKLHLSAVYLKLHVERRGEAIAVARRLEEVRAHQMQQGERGEQVLSWLLPHVVHRRAQRGEVVFRLGEHSRELYYIQSGRVRLHEIDVEMGPGEVMGEIGLFSPSQARTCTALCLTDVDLFCLSSEQARSIYYLNPQFALHIVQLIARRLLADRERNH